MGALKITLAVAALFAVAAQAGENRGSNAFACPNGGCRNIVENQLKRGPASDTQPADRNSEETETTIPATSVPAPATPNADVAPRVPATVERVVR
jgi:hypothetical protein